MKRTRKEMICKAWVRHFGKSTRTGYVWGMGTAWVRLGMPEYVFAFFFSQKYLGLMGYDMGTLGCSWVRRGYATN